MPHKRVFEITLAVMMVLMVGASSALSEDSPWARSNPLDKTMSTFMDSVERMLAENKKMVDTNQSLRDKIKALQEEITAAKNEESRLQAQLGKVDTSYQKKRGAVVGLQEMLTDAAQAQASLNYERMTVEKDLKTKDAEYGDLQKKIETLQKEFVPVSSDAELETRLASLQAERDGLSDQLAVFTKRVEGLNNEWQSLSVSVSSGAGQAQVFEKEQAQLKEQISRKQGSLNSLGQKASEQKKLIEQLSSSAMANELFAKKQSEAAALDLELQALQNGISALEEKAALLTVTEEKETPKRKKKEEMLKDLALSQMSLRSEISRLRQEMVQLDKKKVSLEKSLYQSKP
jgi:predicted  nucleic acid-binding Zn-ribbon protein